MKPFHTCVVACAITSAAALAQSDYSAVSSLSPAPTPAPAAASSEKTAPRTAAYGTVMKGNGASDNTIDDFTRRAHLIDRQYLVGSGGQTLVNGAFSFEAVGFNWFGQAYGGGAPDEVRFGLASSGLFGAGLMVSFAKTTIEDSVGATLVESKTVLEGDGFGFFGSFMLGSIGDVYGEAFVYTGTDALPGADVYNESKTSAATTEYTPRLLHILAGWKRDASSEGTHSLNAEFSLNLHSEENKAVTTTEDELTEMQLAFYHGYVLKDAGGFKVFLGSSTNLVYQDFSFEAAPQDRSRLGLNFAPNISMQKTLAKGFEIFAGADMNWGFTKASNLTLDGGAGAAPDEGTLLLTSGTDVSVGLRWNYENIALEGALVDTFLAHGPHFIGGDDEQGLFGQVGLSVGF
jgi:hypothetical protein